MADSPVAALRERRRQGHLRPDPAQDLAAEKLQVLHQALKDYRPLGHQGAIAVWKARLGLSRQQEDPPSGLYIFGPVGCGKSMLMDLFFDSAPVPREHKRRVHFHAFMIEVHQRLHAWRLRTKGEEADPIPKLAEEIAAETWLLCFDEFQVSNIADAAILGRLFTALFEDGVVVVATSNRAPDDLYLGGLQRELFLPFIALLKEKLDVIAIEGAVDYRLLRLRGRPVYHTPLNEQAATALDEAFATLTENGDGDGHGSGAAPCTISVQGRKVEVPLAAKGVARFTFQELCSRPLGAADYLALATDFHTLIISGIPRLNRDRHNEAVRFMALIDALYEHKVNLICSAEVPPAELYTEGDFAFEFQRTVSRLMEMQSDTYLTAPHLT
jgi:cell division protein ZapE